MRLSVNQTQRSAIPNPNLKPKRDQCLLSASSNSFVVLSVTLGGGVTSSRGFSATSGPVFGDGGADRRLDPAIACWASRAATISATPLPRAPKPGINIQTPQYCLNAQRMTAINRKPKPVNAFVIPCEKSAGSAFAIPLRRLRLRPSGSWPVSACGTRLRFAPHVRQNFPSSLFCDAQFGQYIGVHSPSMIILDRYC